MKKLIKYPGIIILSFAIIIGLFVGYRWFDYKLGKERTESIKEVIRKALEDQSRVDLLLPKTIIIQTKDSLIKLNIDSTRNKLVEIITEKYLCGKSCQDKTLAYEILSLNKENITKDDVNKISNNLTFLNDKISDEVKLCKSNFDEEINKLNRWLTIWIAMIGMIGVFIPIIINWKSIEDLHKIQVKSLRLESKFNRLKSTSNETENKINEADTFLNDNKKTILELPDNIKKLKGLESSIQQLTPQVNQLTRSFDLFKAIDRIEDIDHEFLSRGGIDNFIPNLINRLEDIIRTLSSFKNNLNENNNDIWRYLNHLKMQLSSLVIYGGRHRNQLQPITEFNNQLGILLVQNKEINNEVLEQVIVLINQLVNQLGGA